MSYIIIGLCAAVVILLFSALRLFITVRRLNTFTQDVQAWSGAIEKRVEALEPKRAPPKAPRPPGRVKRG